MWCLFSNQPLRLEHFINCHWQEYEEYQERDEHKSPSHHKEQFRRDDADILWGVGAEGHHRDSQVNKKNRDRNRNNSKDQVDKITINSMRLISRIFITLPPFHWTSIHFSEP